MTIIRSKNGCVLGRFTKTAWSSSGLEKADPSAFLFTLESPYGIPPTKYSIRKHCIRYAVCHKLASGPTFGSINNGGSDIFLYSPSNVVGSQTHFPGTYEYATRKGKVTFTSDSHFIVMIGNIYTSLGVFNLYHNITL